MIKKIITWLTSLFGFSPNAVKMFTLANDISGLNKNTLPTELLPLNAVQFSRGLLNYAVIQSRLDWVLPYWAVRQYNPQSSSFIPRSHLGLSMNVTERNWTAVGNPNCSIEPIVDPRGMVTPFKNGWSVDVWLMVGDKIILPSMEGEVIQLLENDLPIVNTKFNFENGLLSSTAYTINSDLFISASGNLNNKEISSLIFSVRPFNPEGISPIHGISFDFDSCNFIIDKKAKLVFDKKPSFVYCSNLNEGDAFNILKNVQTKTLSYCEYGLANAIAVFDLHENEINVSCKINLDLNFSDDKFYPSRDSSDYWKSLLKRGAEINTPDKKLNSLFKFSIASLLMFLDKDTITPGPFTYHQFWIRDSVFMLEALDKAGYSDMTLNVLKTFVSVQDREGFYRSQKGEWDSNGQILWYIYRRALITENYAALKNIFESLRKGALWIDKFRLKDKKYIDESFYGLFPAGLSAEHLGLVDHYFWDNFWALAGLSAFANIQSLLGNGKNIPGLDILIQKYKTDLENAISKVQARFCIDSIPASTTRGIDCGMIGSLSAIYPTQLYDQKDSRIISTLNTIVSKYFYKGLFFQNFIHSGMNIYLSMQVAHSFLYCGNRKKFWEILNNVISKASSTLNFPEAIHPLTGGGVMGDGHHGWASAEIVSAVRDAFVYEKFNTSLHFEELILFAGIPSEWLEGNESFSVSNLPVVGGVISFSIIPASCCVKININFIKNSDSSTKMKLILPANFKSVNVDGKMICNCYLEETPLDISSAAKEIVLYRLD